MPVKHPPDQQTTTPDNAQSLEAVPEVVLNKVLLTQLLSSEIAFAQGEFKYANELMYAAASKSRDPRLAAKAAYRALRSGEAEQARLAGELWLQILNQTPTASLTEVNLLLSASSIELDQADLALKYLLAAQQTATSDYKIYKRAASEFSRLNNKELALEIYQQMLLSARQPSLAYVGLAVLAARFDDQELSAQAADQALLADTKLEDAALIKLVYLSKQDKPEETQLFARKFLSKAPSAHQLRMEYAHYLTSQDKIKEAIVQFKKVARAGEKQANEANLAIVSLSFDNEDYALADARLELMLEHNPSDNRLRFLRCQSLRELNDYTQALELCYSISYGEYYFPAQLEIASIMAEQAQMESALEFLALVPVIGAEQSVRVIMNKHTILLEDKQLERALKVLNLGLRDYSDNTPLLYARGLLLSRLDRVAEHERDMRRLIRLEPDNAHAYNALGYTLANLTDRYTEALELVQQANQLMPKDAFILDSLGWVYFKLNDYEKAKTFLEQAFSIQNDAEIAAHLGEIYWLMGEKSKARSVWRKAIKLTPDNDTLVSTLERFL